MILIGDGCRVAVDLLPQGIKTIIYNFKKPIGPLKARNKAINLAKGELVAFIDADCITEERWLSNLASGFANGEIGGCGGKIVEAEPASTNEDRIYGVEFLRLWHLFYLPFAGFGNAIFRKNVLKEIGLLDESLDKYGDDIDLSWRIYLKGYRIEYVPDAIVTHTRGRPTTKTLFLYGEHTRGLITKYRRVLNFYSRGRLMAYLKSTLRNRKNLVIICGYICGWVKEKLHLTRRITPMALTDTVSRSASPPGPLGITIGPTPLVRPRHVIWWKSQDSSCRIANLKTKKQHILEGISARMWECMMNRKSKESIAEEISTEYDVDNDVLKKDLDEFINELCNGKLLEVYK